MCIVDRGYRTSTTYPGVQLLMVVHTSSYHGLIDTASTLHQGKHALLDVLMSPMQEGVWCISRSLIFTYINNENELS